MFEWFKTFTKAQLSAFIGGVSDYAIMIFLTEVLGIYYPISIAVSCTLGAVINFSLNKCWAFRPKEQPYKFTFTQQLRRFIIVVVSSILLKIVGTWLITTFIGFDYKISRVITDLLVSLGFNYTLQRYWVFSCKECAN
ncbi:MAG: GtrA family protein [Prevotellaceae bacterium]|jgi:putative flippase GtrA|nr:GtrA family protein [Prevotellaceae bacterium]